MDGKSHFIGNLALHHGSIAFMTDQQNYPIEIAGSILERNGVNALQEVLKGKSVRQWLVMRGVQARWVDRLESAQGKLSLGVRDNYAFHVIQGQLKLTKVSMAQQEQIVWAEKNSMIDLTEFIMRDHVFSVGMHPLFVISLDTYLSLDNSEFSNIYCPLQH